MSSTQTILISKPNTISIPTLPRPPSPSGSSSIPNATIPNATIPNASIPNAPVIISIPRIPTPSPKLTPIRIPSPSATPDYSHNRTDVPYIVDVPITLPNGERKDLLLVNDPLSMPVVTNLNELVSKNNPTSQISKLNRPWHSLNEFEENDVERRLADRGYLTLERILVSTPVGTEGRYLKVVGNTGQIALVELDQDGVVAVRPNDLILVESETPSVIPVSIKTGTYETAGLEVNGVAFECENGYCTIMRENSTLAPKEVSLTTINKVDQATSTPTLRVSVSKKDGIPVSYPIVKYSEIMANPCSVTKAIDIVTRKLRNNMYKICLEELEQMKKSLEKANVEYNKYIEQQKESFKEIGNTIRQLESYRKDFDDFPPQSPNESEKVRKIALNLKSRHLLLTEQMLSCQVITNHRREIEALTDKFVSFRNVLVEQTRDINLTCRDCN